MCFTRVIYSFATAQFLQVASQPPEVFRIYAAEVHDNLYCFNLQSCRASHFLPVIVDIDLQYCFSLFLFFPFLRFFFRLDS